MRQTDDSPIAFSPLGLFIDKIKETLPLNQICSFVDNDIGDIHFILKVKKYLYNEFLTCKMKNRFFYYEGVNGALILWCLGVWSNGSNKAYYFANYFNFEDPTDNKNITSISKVYKKIRLHFLSDTIEYLGKLELEYYQQDELNFFIDRVKVYLNQITENNFDKTKKAFLEEFSFNTLLPAHEKESD